MMGVTYSLSSAVSVKIRQTLLLFKYVTKLFAFEGLRDRQVELAYLGIVMLFGDRIPGQVVSP